MTIQALTRSRTDVLRRRVGVALSAGFAVAAILLILAGTAGIEAAALVEQSAAQLAREQAQTATLISHLEQGQSAMRELLLDSSDPAGDLDRARLVRLARQFAKELEAVQAPAVELGFAAEWEQIDRTVRQIEAGLAASDGPPRDGKAMDDLLALHVDALVSLRSVAEEGQEAALAAEAELLQRSRSLRSTVLFTVAGCFGALLLVAFLSVRHAAALVDEIRAGQDELSTVSAQMLERQEAAARRLSHELHDELGQTLGAVKANLAVLESRDAESARRRDDCVALIDQAIGSVREMSRLLHPTVLDDFGLTGALKWLAEGFEKRTGIRVECNSDFEGRLSDEARVHLFRIAQESLTNVARHSSAKKVQISLHCAGDTVRLRIVDDGRGAPERKPGFGLLGMRARARMAGGELRWRSAPGRGVTVEVTAPVARPEEERLSDARGDWP